MALRWSARRRRPAPRAVRGGGPTGAIRCRAGRGWGGPVRGPAVRCGSPGGRAGHSDLRVGARLLGTSDTGAVFDFTQSDGFPRRVTFRKPTPTAGDFFGAAIAVDGETVAIGAPFDNTAAPNGGAVYLFRRSTAELGRADPLVSGTPGERELFGSALPISPQWIVVGAPPPDRNHQPA